MKKKAETVLNKEEVVLILVQGGIAQVIHAPKGISVIIVDHDIMETDDLTLSDYMPEDYEDFILAHFPHIA